MSKKLKIWSSEPSQQYEPNQLFLRLTYVKEDILLSLVDKEGNEVKDGKLIAYDNNLRCFLLLDNCPDDMPIKTDVHGYPICVEIDEMRQRQTNVQVHHICLSGKKDETQESCSTH